jgi:hypothetical protein
MRSTRWPRGAVRGASSTLRWAGGCFATAAALTLTGCVPTPAEPAVTPSASASSSAPVVFASDEEALATARSTYERFVSTIDTVVAENGQRPERIDEFAVPTLAEEEKQGVQEFLENGFKISGRSLVTNAILQSRTENAGGTNVVTLYVCVDISDVEVMDRSGNSAVESTRPDQNSFEVTFDSGDDQPVGLLVSSTSVWNGGSVC